MRPFERAKIILGLVTVCAALLLASPGVRVAPALAGDQVSEELVSEDQVSEAPVSEELVSEDRVSEAPVSEELISEDQVSEAPVSEELISVDQVSEAQVSEELVSTDQPGPQCTANQPPRADAEIEALIAQLRQEQMAQMAQSEGGLIVLNGRGYNYGPPPGIQLDRIQAESRQAPSR